MRIRILLFGVAVLLAIRTGKASERVVLEVRETAGIERFHYPTTAEVRLPLRVTETTPLRLLNGEKSVTAQFTPLAEDPKSEMRRWSIDFGLDLAPNETRQLVLEYGAGVSPRPEPRRGLKVERGGGMIRVRHPSLEFVVPENLDGLFQAIRVADDAWLAGPAAGLVLTTRDDKRVEVRAADSMRVTKSGPLAAALESTGSTTLADGEKIGWVVKLDFPLGKSWVKVDCTLHDPQDLVSKLSAELQFRLEADGRPPVMADVGAAGWTYAALQRDESLVFRAAPQSTNETAANWLVARKRHGQAKPYVVPPSDGNVPAPQGWAHLMDAKRATAIALDQFAENTADTMELSADGKTRLEREFQAMEKRTEPHAKRLVFWLHVVSSPPQWGAATSPQSMLAPPEVRVGTSGSTSEPSR